jgi:hypothetical protein
MSLNDSVLSVNSTASLNETIVVMDESMVSSGTVLLGDSGSELEANQSATSS